MKYKQGVPLPVQDRRSRCKQVLEAVAYSGVRENMDGEMDVHLAYEKNSVAGNNSDNSRNGQLSKKIQIEHGKAVISIHSDRSGQFEPIAVLKHETEA